MLSDISALLAILWRVVQLLLPALIPSWRFFKTVAPSPRIEVQNDGTWVEADPRPQTIGMATRIKRLFWNPAWNGYLFKVSLSERQVVEPSDFTSKELTRRLADHVPPQRESFQYRLTFVSREGEDIVTYVEYESPLVARNGANDLTAGQMQ